MAWGTLLEKQLLLLTILDESEMCVHLCSSLVTQVSRSTECRVLVWDSAWPLGAQRHHDGDAGEGHDVMMTATGSGVWVRPRPTGWKRKENLPG